MVGRVEDTPAYTRLFWAKADRHDRRRIHLLEHHLADVGACFEALLAQPIIRHRLARTAGLDDLDAATAARLAVFAALHDIGKVNVGFQARIWRPADLAGKRKPQRTGHTLDLKPVLTRDDETTAAWFFKALEWGDVLEWDDKGGETACALFVAALSHHGKPLNLLDSRSANPPAWRDFGELDPRRCVERIGKLVQEWFPKAFESGAPPLPSAPTFQHMFLGLCNWADWLGSNECWFPYCDRPDDNYIATARQQAKRAVKSIGLNLSDQRHGFAGVPGFGELFDIAGAPTPNAIQETAAQDTPLDRQLVIIESETGSGKTEAALWRFARMYERGLVDGLYFALPTRAAAVQIHGRVERFIAKLLPEHRPPVVLAVPGYKPDPAAADVVMPPYDHGAAGELERDRPWASENPKRYLAAQIAVGTVDQAMLGALQVKNAHLRAACLARNLLVVDEVHASDTYMSVILEQLLAAHRCAGGYALLMSATLGSAARSRWLFRPGRESEAPPLALDEAINTAYPAVTTAEEVRPAGENDQEKQVRIAAVPRMHDCANTAQRALTAARAGAKVLVVRNTVDYAIETQEALEALTGPADAGLLFTVRGKRTLHHGRFAAGDRRLLDKEVERQLGKGQPGNERPPGGHIVVGTQTLEQSLDIDADLLITDLCPVDVLLQRIGRLHRHRHNDPRRPTSYDEPACTVLTLPDSDLTPLLEYTPKANGLGPHGYVYEDLRILEATRRLIDEYPERRIPEMNRRLVERATHPQALGDISCEMGEDWQSHALAIQGGEIGDGQTARGVTIRRNGSFLTDNRDIVFVSSDENIRTRLGDDRIDVILDPPQPSPFDGAQQIATLAVSVRWLPSDEAPESVAPALAGDGFEFALGERRCRYDRRGLRRL